MLLWYHIFKYFLTILKNHKTVFSDTLSNIVIIIFYCYNSLLCMNVCHNEELNELKCHISGMSIRLVVELWRTRVHWELKPIVSVITNPLFAHLFYYFLNFVCLFLFSSTFWDRFEQIVIICFFWYCTYILSYNYYFLIPIILLICF